MSAQDDKQSLDDLKEVERAMIDARHSLISAMVGQGQAARDAFNYHVGFARGRIARVSARITGEETPLNDDDRGDAP